MSRSIRLFSGALRARLARFVALAFITPGILGIWHSTTSAAPVRIGVMGGQHQRWQRRFWGRFAQLDLAAQ